MTGNVVFIAFALTGVPGLSVPRSLTALAAFLAGAVVGGRLANRGGTEGPSRAAPAGSALEAALLAASALVAVGLAEQSVDSYRAYALIVLTALAMGIRNAVVRKLAVPDLTTTVLTLTITGLGADSFLAGGSGQRWKRRVGSILAMLFGAAVGALLVRRSVAATLALASGAAALCTVTLWYRRRRRP
jgi:uncharacterized membrane protein YoaK (UPF0700 family)